MYTAYSDQSVFADGTANIVCNRINDILEDHFSQTVESMPFFLTGKAARILQDSPSITPVTVISFGTSDVKIFEYCRKQMGAALGAQGTFSLSDQAQIRYSDAIFLEVWLLPAPGSLHDEKGVLMQLSEDIPPYIL